MNGVSVVFYMNNSNKSMLWSNVYVLPRVGELIEIFGDTYKIKEIRWTDPHRVEIEIH